MTTKKHALTHFSVQRLLALRRWIGILVAAPSVLSISLMAQTATGRVIGVVSDPQGALVAGARVTVVNTGTDAALNTVTRTDGTYEVLDLPIGTYAVRVEAQGFAKMVTSPQPLNINQSLRIDVHLKLGAASEVVDVQSEAGQVESVNPTVGATVTGAPIQNLPLNGRDVLDLALTEPGVTPAPGSVLAGFPSGIFSVSGGRDNSITYLLDGGDNTSVTYGIPVMDPNPDAIAQFRILTSNYAVEYGRSGGGVVSVVTKSGTNQLHGSVFDYLRNDAFNANTFFNNEAGQARPVLKRNQFGGTVGGPIIIPDLVGKDRFFFFFGYQGQRQKSTTVGSEGTTFTPGELGGDFSHSVNGGPDPGVAAFLLSNPSFQSNSALAAQAIIDPTKINPVAQGYITNKLIPVTSSGVIVPNGPGTDDRDEYIERFDFNTTTKDRLL
jgi:hypothetical protein